MKSEYIKDSVKKIIEKKFNVGKLPLQNQASENPKPQTLADATNEILQSNQHLALTGKNCSGMTYALDKIISESIISNKGILISCLEISTNPSRISKITDLCDKQGRKFQIFDLDVFINNKSQTVRYNPFEGMNTYQIAETIVKADQIFNYALIDLECRELAKVIEMKFGANPINLKIDSLLNHLKKTATQNPAQNLQTYINFLNRLYGTILWKSLNNKSEKIPALDLRGVIQNRNIVIIKTSITTLSTQGFDVLNALFSAHFDLLIKNIHESQPSTIITNEDFFLCYQDFFKIARRCQAQCIHIANELHELKFRHNTLNWFYNADYFLNFKNSPYKIVEYNSHADLFSTGVINDYNDLDTNECQFVNNNLSTIIKTTNVEPA